MAEAFDPRHVKSTRKECQCHGCLETIPIGSRAVKQAGTHGGDFWSIVWCGACWDRLKATPGFWDEFPDGCMPGDVGDARAALSPTRE